MTGSAQRATVAAEPADATLKARNLAALTARWPELHDVLTAIGTPAARLIGARETGDLNLDLGHTMLYPVDAARFADDQVASYLARPGRFYVDPPERAPDTPQHQYHVSEALYRHLGDRTLPHVPDRPALDEGGFLAIFGVGLGLHLPRLLAETPVRHVILVEEHAEFLLHSLDLIDWTAVLAGIEARGQTIHLLFGDEPSAVGARLHWYFRGRGFGLIDGSYLFRHYSSPLLDGVYKYFVENLPLLAISIGFFEDEVVMINHATQNFWRNRFQLLDLAPRLVKRAPAVVVGSGPSLDGTIEELRRLGPDAVIFSAGTSLMPLLRAGIRPDFHAELENTSSSLDHLVVVRDRYGLDGITLLASATVHPELASLFEKKIYFFRDSISSTVLWCPDGEGLLGTAPTCTNLALRAAQIMGFRDLYLFGVDMGTRDARDHHAKGAIYQEDAAWARIETDPVRLMSIEMPGNFGGLAYTNQILQWARMQMAQAIKVFAQGRIANCSDGISIPGTVPKLARTIDLGEAAGQKPRSLASLNAELKRFEAGALAPLDRVVAVRAAFRDYYADLRRLVAEARTEGLSFVAFYERLEPYFAKDGGRPFQRLLRSVNIGTIMMCCQIANYFCRRVAPAEEPAVMRVFLGSLDERLTAMADALDSLYGEFVDIRGGRRTWFQGAPVD